MNLKKTVLTALVTGIAALGVAVPAQAELVGGVVNGGCITGIQVGHVTRSDGSILPICRTFN